MSDVLIEPLRKTVESLSHEFGSIPSDRKLLLTDLARFMRSRTVNNLTVHLNFICTHNSRRSHMAQLWAQAAACYYDIHDVTCFSGGTEATAFNPRAVRAMQDLGFEIKAVNETSNPLYRVRFAENQPPINVFSKRYDDPENVVQDFAAVMTCSHADEHCPVIAGASMRIPLTYDDPKEFDGADVEGEKYRERARQIGRELLFAFDQVKKLSTAQ